MQYKDPVALLCQTNLLYQQFIKLLFLHNLYLTIVVVIIMQGYQT